MSKYFDKMVTVKMYPVIGDVFEVILHIPNDEDTDEFIEKFIEEMFKRNFIESYEKVNYTENH